MRGLLYIAHRDECSLWCQRGATRRGSGQGLIITFGSFTPIWPTTVYLYSPYSASGLTAPLETLPPGGIWNVAAVKGDPSSEANAMNPPFFENHVTCSLALLLISISSWSTPPSSSV